MIDHRSYTHNLNSCEIKTGLKTEKKQQVTRARNIFLQWSIK